MNSIKKSILFSWMREKYVIQVSVKISGSNRTVKMSSSKDLCWYSGNSELRPLSVYLLRAKYGSENTTFRSIMVKISLPQYSHKLDFSILKEYWERSAMLKWRTSKNLKKNSKPYSHYKKTVPTCVRTSGSEDFCKTSISLSI